MGVNMGIITNQDKLRMWIKIQNVDKNKNKRTNLNRYYLQYYLQALSSIRPGARKIKDIIKCKRCFPKRP